MTKYFNILIRSFACSILLFTATTIYAQTVSITAIDPGPYSPGSSLAVKIGLDNSTCITTQNVFKLYLSDANGDFTNEVLIGSYNGFNTNGAYATFINGVVPTTTAPGTGYKVRVKTTAPAVVSAESASFYIIPGSGTSASATSGVIDPAFPEVYGTCTGRDNTSFSFQNTSTAGSTVTATFYNDVAGTNEGTMIFPATNFVTFHAQAANYTVFVRALNGSGGVGTKAYLLMNNVINTNFGTTSAGPVCLTSTGATVSYSVDLTSTTSGIQRNYPGTIYNISWGDGSSNNYTFCQIEAVAGHFTHNYIASSCGQKFNGSITNAYQISFTAKNPFCSSNIPINVFQAILTPPKNSMTGPSIACIGSTTSFTNTSFPGQAVGTKTSNCADANATYSWFIDGVQQASGLKVATKFDWIFTTSGSHTVTVRLENSSSGCVPDDYTMTICAQAPPQPKFTLSATTVCAPGTVTITDNSVLDNTCSNNFTYLWTVTPSTGFSFASGNKNSKVPSFKFNTQGKYTVQLQITSPGTTCTAQTYADTVYVNSTPKVTLSPAFSTCGNQQTLKFSDAPGKTQTIFTGTYQTLPDTYLWTVTSSTGAGAAQFVNGSTSASQFPAIMFPDFGTYTVTVTQKNSCGTTATSSQDITFQNAPTVNAGDDVSVCANQPVTLNATVTNGGSVNGAPTWSSGTASGFSDIHSYNPTYTPTAAEIAAGTVTLTITVPTSLTGDCSSITDNITINVSPQNTITSAADRSVCSGSPMSYQPASTIGGSTFTWTAAGSATATGFTASGTGDINEPSLSNTSATTVATVTYTITPHNNGCDGVPFTFTVSIVPKPVITATGPGAICSGQPSGITLSSNVSSTTYTWGAVTSDPANVTGFSNMANPTSASEIQDVLINTGTAPATVTYTINSSGAGADNCAGNTQTVTITVQPTTVIANAGNNESLCSAATYQLQGNDLGPNGHGMWTLQSGQPGIIFDDPTKFNAIASGLQGNQSYVFRWTSKGALPCNDNYSEVTIKDQNSALVIGFTADKPVGCDALTVKFTNTSSAGPDVIYAWDFGNGITSTLKDPAPVTFVGQANGRDSIYTVKLTVSNNCTTETKELTITVKPNKPIAQIAPDKTTGCIPFTVNLENLSPGTNDRYTYFLLDANNNVLSQFSRTDKETQQFTMTTPGTYKVYMVAKNQCGMANSPQYTLVVTPANATPRLTVNGNENTGCGPLTVTFHNNTTGASSYRYDWGDGTNSLVTNSAGDVNHTFVKGGTYKVVLHASNGCTVDVASAPVTINVLYQPELSFKADIDNGCKNLTVQFSNNTKDPSASQTADLVYDWDFGDGSPHSGAVNPVHKYGSQGSPFTVTLTATNGTGCPSTLAMKDMITVNQPSLTDFTVKPDSVINIPDYHFSFVDLTTGGPISWQWSFGDGSSSIQRNPEHTYADTGYYKVTLTTHNAFCDSTKTHYVRITGVPGQVYVPNAMMPTSVTPDLRTFKMKGSGLQEWHLQIFNNYGQMIYETSALDEKGQPTGEWDGTFKGSPMPQGVYVWQATGKFINGNEWKGMSYNGSAPKRTGVIHLIR